MNSQSAGALGGERSARMLRVRAGNAQRFLAMARDKAKRLPVLRRARKQLRAFRILVQRDARRRRIDPELARELLDAAGDASASIDGLR